MPDRRSCLADRLDPLFALVASERALLERLEEQPRTIRRGAVIRRENDPGSDLLIVRKGWMYASLLLDNGSRQILGMYFPGDVCGNGSLVLGRAAETLVAVTDMEICHVDRATFRQIFVDQPRLAAIFYTMAQVERISLADRLTAIGQLPARARVAGLLVEIVTKLRLLDPTLGDSFALGLTQEEIGDATGLTAVHVNRMMRTLAEEGLIERYNSHVRIVAEDRLRALANHADREQQIDAGWLPPPR